MPRRKVQFNGNSFYHLFNRGNRKQIIFFDDFDYQRFLEKVKEYRTKYGVDIIAYCLLPNHFHFLIKQLTDIPPSKFIGTLLNSHARFITIKHSLAPGHVFQGRFGAKLIETPESLLQVSRYIHLNPIKGKILDYDYTYKQSRLIKDRSLVEAIRLYRWSSYKDYLRKGPADPGLINPQPILEIEGKVGKYRKFVESKITDEDMLNFEKF